MCMFGVIKSFPTSCSAILQNCKSRASAIKVQNPLDAGSGCRQMHIVKALLAEPKTPLESSVFI